MLNRPSTGVVAAALTSTPTATIMMTIMMMTIGGARAADDGKYPTGWKGEWTRVVHREVEVQGAFDQTKPWGLGQDAPLTPEYRKVLADSMADQANGGLGNYPTSRCLPSGMPRMMTFASQEYVITPETTYILLSGSDHLRRIFTDGLRLAQEPTAGPTAATPSAAGSTRTATAAGIDTLSKSETRHFKGPRAFDASGLPLAFDKQSVFKERFFVDQSNPDIFHVLTTVIDNALTRPWTSDRQ